MAWTMAAWIVPLDLRAGLPCLSFARVGTTEWHPARLNVADFKAIKAAMLLLICHIGPLSQDRRAVLLLPSSRHADCAALVVGQTVVLWNFRADIANGSHINYLSGCNNP